MFLIDLPHRRVQQLAGFSGDSQLTEFSLDNQQQSITARLQVPYYSLLSLLPGADGAALVVTKNWIVSAP